MRAAAALFTLLLLATGLSAAFAAGAVVDAFSPQGAVKGIRQATARFSEQIVPFGEPRQVDPFDIKCPEPGRGRWVDGRTWAYDFERDIPAGVACEFTLKEGLKTLGGGAIGGRKKFSFSTGGPAILESVPYEGSENLDEDQAFVLILDAEASASSVLSSVYFSIEGINERVGAKIIEGTERDAIIKSAGYRDDKRAIIIIQAKQNFPSDRQVSIIWGKGVSSASGILVENDQTLAFRTRSPFTASFSCQRENAEAGCIPMLPMRLSFSSPVSADVALKIRLKDAGGKIFIPVKPSNAEDYVYSATFKAPLPESSSFTLEIPAGMKDESGRALSNAGNFPLAVKTAEYPPLAKFSARFGIIEREDATLPVTLRNIEPEIKAALEGYERQILTWQERLTAHALELAVEFGEYIRSILPDSMRDTGAGFTENLQGRVRRIQAEKSKGAVGEKEVIEWLRRVASADRTTSIFSPSDGNFAPQKPEKEFTLPKPSGAKAFEVVGIPLKDAGFYVVEIQSQILGASLLGEQKPMYVPTVALVTNLSAHFKWGRENSIVWVTTLNKGRPVNFAGVSIRDCEGNLLWEGRTGRDGIARVQIALPTQDNLPYCSFNVNYGESGGALEGIGGGLFVFAKTTDDMTFVHSSWDDGIQPWRFNLPDGYYDSERQGKVARTILDRSLFRAGETAQMKHILRRHTGGGFESVPENEAPDTLLIEHAGSGERYKIPVAWSASGAAESQWAIPRNAKLGVYSLILLTEAEEENYAKRFRSGEFRVQEFRAPLMRGAVQTPPRQLIKPKEVSVDLSAAYLSGGGASDLPVKLRAEVRQSYPGRFEGFEGFSFSAGRAKEGVERGDGYGYGDFNSAPAGVKLPTLSINLDKAGAARVALTGIPEIDSPKELLAELEFKDPNGETQTVSAKIPLWHSGVLVGIKPDSWTLAKDALNYKIAVVDPQGYPVSGAKVSVNLFERKTYSHRKRLVGGFYSYENINEVRRLKSGVCSGATDKNGFLRCESRADASGNLIIEAATEDGAGNKSFSNSEVWVAGGDEWWFEAEKDDRMDFIPEKKRYEPEETARFQMRMPFREASALVTVEREGIIDAYVKTLSGRTPVVEIPIKGNYAPNVFVSALAVRGRVSDIKPAATVDLGRPAFKLGVSEIKVGWRAHELKVSVSTDKSVYKIRERIKAKISVAHPSGAKLPRGGEVALAAVDEGLLELMPNTTWNLLEGMMEQRGYEVKTSTAQMQVVGRRHYGLKSLPQGGGGGRGVTRELFDTLLLWRGTVALDEKGEASVEIPINDSLTSFRIVAVATVGAGLFGRGETSVRASQDLILASGIPPAVREGDRFKAVFTVRNASDRKMSVELGGAVLDGNLTLPPITETLGAGEAKEVGWEVEIPAGRETFTYEITAGEKGGRGAADKLIAKQRISPAVPMRVYQATLVQVDGSFAVDLAKPADSIAGTGKVKVSLRPKISGGLPGVMRYMRDYPYSCMEQRTSRAVALRDAALWEGVAAEMPSYLDGDGLVKYFPAMPLGSDVLTSYILSITSEAGYEIPSDVKARMATALREFIEGRVVRYSALPTADLAIRKLSALEALSRIGVDEPKLISSIFVEPNLLPTSALIDWINILERMKSTANREGKLENAMQVLRSRLNLQGTTMGFSTESGDNLWWLMVSGDANAARVLLAMTSFNFWREDAPRIAKGTLSRMRSGHWDTTVANAWGTLAMERFSREFESTPVEGKTASKAGETRKTLDWAALPNGGAGTFPVGDGEKLEIVHEGGGKPWASVESIAAIPLKEALSSGYKIRKTLTAVERKTEGKWTRGDILRVRLEMEAQADMTWVVVDDPIPAGSTILGTGLGRDSELLTQGEEREGWIYPAFEERSFQAFRAYYEYLPKGAWTVEYTVRLNSGGEFKLPTTRVEALYAPEMFGEIPNAALRVE